jgi:AAA domain
VKRPNPSHNGTPDSEPLWPEDGPSAAPGATESEAGDPVEPRVDTDLSSAADIVPTRVQWMWKDRIALGKVTILDGRPGLGKSCMTLDIAARVTRGREMPDGFDPAMGPRNVLIVTAEDDWEDTVVPRLMAAGADLTRVFRLDDLEIPGGVLELEKRVVEHAAALVIIDPLVAFVPSKYNLYRDQDSRAALKPLAAVAGRTGAAVVGLRHVNKAQGVPAQDRGTGSVAIGGAARSNLIAGPDPDHEDHFVLASIKNNLGPKPPSLGYSLEPVEVSLPDGFAQVVVVRWEGTVDLDADDLVVGEKQGEAVAFLEGELANGPKPSKVLEAAAASRGLSWTGAVRRASVRLGVIKWTPEVGVSGAAWMWRLPDR